MIFISSDDERDLDIDVMQNYLMEENDFSSDDNLIEL